MCARQRHTNPRLRAHSPGNRCFARSVPSTRKRLAGYAMTRPDWYLRCSRTSSSASIQQFVVVFPRSHRSEGAPEKHKSKLVRERESEAGGQGTLIKEAIMHDTHSWKFCAELVRSSVLMLTRYGPAKRTVVTSHFLEGELSRPRRTRHGCIYLRAFRGNLSRYMHAYEDPPPLWELRHFRVSGID